MFYSRIKFFWTLIFTLLLLLGFSVNKSSTQNYPIDISPNKQIKSGYTVTVKNSTAYTKIDSFYHKGTYQNAKSSVNRLWRSLKPGESYSLKLPPGIYNFCAKTSYNFFSTNYYRDVTWKDIRVYSNQDLILDTETSLENGTILSLDCLFFHS